MKNKMKKCLAAGAMTLMLAGPSFAQMTGNAAQVNTFLTSAASWLVTILGPSLFLIGVIMVGISMSLGNEDAMRKGFYVLGGGVLIFLANPLVMVLKGLTGN